MAKRGSSHKVTRKIQTAAVLKAYSSDKSVAELVSAGEQVSSATAFSVAGWERAKLETQVLAKSTADQQKGSVIFRFGASIDGSSYDQSIVAAAVVSNSWKSITMVASAETTTKTQRRITSCDVAGLATVKLLGVTNAGSGGVIVNARMVKAR